MGVLNWVSYRANADKNNEGVLSRMRKTWLAAIMAIVMAALFVAGCGDSKPAAPAAPAKKVIKVSIGLNEQHPEYLGLKKFKEEVEKKTNGRYDVQLYPNAQLGDDVASGGKPWLEPQGQRRDAQRQAGQGQTADTDDQAGD